MAAAPSPRRSPAARLGRFAIGLVAVVAGLAVVAWTGLWFWAAASVEGLLEDWAAAERARGATIEWQAFETSGFPVRIRMAAEAVTVDRPGQGVWRVPDLSAAAVPWRPTAVTVSAPRGVTAALPLQVPGAVPTTVDVDRAEGTVVFALDGRVREAEIDLAEGRVRGLPGLASVAAVAAETRPASGPEGGPRQSLSLAVDGVGLDPALPVGEALGTTIERLRLAAAVDGPLPPVVTPATLAAWRDAGGAVPVETLALDWGPLEIRGAGTLGLDALLRPEGVLRLEIAGFEPAIQALVEAGVIGRREAGFVLGTLTGLAGPPDADGVRRAEAPVRFAEGWLAIGPIPIARLEPLVR
jgi:hypothetical protein